MRCALLLTRTRCSAPAPPAQNPQVQNYFHVADHLRGIWFANISNSLLAFTYSKARAGRLLYFLGRMQKGTASACRCLLGRGSDA